MPPVDHSISPLPGGDRKRTRLQTISDVNSRENDHGAIISEAGTKDSGNIEPYHCTKEPQDMSHDKITYYMDELPAATQYYDLNTLFVVHEDDLRDWSEYKTVWCELRGYHVNYLRMIEGAPEIQRGSQVVPPISRFKQRLRAVVTYKALLIQAKERDVPAEITLELARKLLDYLVLCFKRAKFETMGKVMPDFKTTFFLATEAIKNNPVFTQTREQGHMISEEQVDTRRLGVAVTQPGHSQAAYASDDIDNLKMDSAAIAAPMEQWDAIAGNKMAKEALFESVVESRLFPQLFDGVENILLFGPPGTGKTVMVECLVAMSSWSVFRVGLHDFKDVYQGESEKKLKRIYDRAKECSPAIIFFDQVESLMASRTDVQSEGASAIKTSLLAIISEMTSSRAEVMTIATTHRPQALDNAFLRRFQQRVYVGLPDASAIFQILEAQLKRRDHDQFLDTAQGRQELNLLAGRCIKNGNKQRRWLTGDDIDSAMSLMMERKRREVRNTKYFEEHNLRDGNKILLPCGPKAGAIRKKALELDPVDQKRMRCTLVQLGDIEKALDGIRGLTTAKEMEELEAWNRSMGQ